MSAEPQYLYLTTTGRRSGQPREIEIWFTELDGRYYIISELGRRSQWVRNLEARPHVHVRVGKREFAAIARVVPESTERALWTMVRAGSVEKYGWGNGLIVELRPEHG